MKESYVCECKNINIGSYDNQVVLHKPKRMIGDGRIPFKDSKTVCIDKCIADEILQLWEIGITTTGCCCGHGVQEPFIGVVDEDIQKMKQLGYRKANNTTDIDREDSFLPIGYDGFLPPFSNHDPKGFYCIGFNKGIEHANSLRIENEIVAKSDNLIFVWKEDGTGVEYVEAYFDGTDMIDIEDQHEIIVIKQNETKKAMDDISKGINV